MNFSAAFRNVLLSCVIASVVAGAVGFTGQAFASPPPPPPKQIKLTFLTHPHANHMGRQYVTRMKMWYNDTLFYEGTSPYAQNYPDGLSSGTFNPGGTLKMELSVLDTAGRVLASQTQTKTNAFNGGTAWLGGQVFTPDRKHTHIWTNGFNQEIYGYLQLQFSIEERDY